MNWQKKGLIFEPDGQYDWLQTHASVPFATHIEDDRYRVYFGGRNSENETQPGYVHIELNDKQIEVTDVSDEPVLRTGDIGTFDADGIWPSWFVEIDGTVYMYYNGWIKGGGDVPYYSTTGLAISEDGGDSFERYTNAPLLGRNEVDPYILGGPCVLVEDGEWRMWYLSGIDFRVEREGPMYYYHIKYAESEDGIEWERTGGVCIDHKSDEETRIARPCVRKEDEKYRMWYCYASGYEGYRIGYAESDDGINWARKDDEAGIDVSEEGWDSEMVAYPYVFEHDGRKYMLYNGNGYGETGFGYAVLEED